MPDLTYHRSRLPRRSSTCDSGKAQPAYNLAFHVGGLLIILFVSGSACAFPLLVLKLPRLRIPPSFLFGAKHFGTGVLMATSFVHLLPTAFLSLSNACLSSFWTADYQAMPGAIMLASIFFVTIIEMVFSPAQHVCGGNEGVVAASPSRLEKSNAATAAAAAQSDALPPCAPHDEMRRTYSGASLVVRDLGMLRGRTGSISRTLSRYREDEPRPDAIEPKNSEGQPPMGTSKLRGIHDTVKHDSKNSIQAVPEPVQPNHLLAPEQVHKKAIMQVFLLEMGILFHSIFIGMSLAVAVGNDFTVLLIAIVFHRRFTRSRPHYLNSPLP